MPRSFPSRSGSDASSTSDAAKQLRSVRSLSSPCLDNDVLRLETLLDRCQDGSSEGPCPTDFTVYFEPRIFVRVLAFVGDSPPRGSFPCPSPQGLGGGPFRGGLWRRLPDSPLSSPFLFFTDFVAVFARRTAPAVFGCLLCLCLRPPSPAPRGPRLPSSFFPEPSSPAPGSSRLRFVHYAGRRGPLLRHEKLLSRPSSGGHTLSVSPF